MSDIAIKSEGLGKCYRLGVSENIFAHPLRALAGLWGSSEQVEQQHELWALKDADFEIKHGEVVGIIGRNGSGKSTLLKILTGITEPTVGHADIYGRVGSLLEVGTGFHPELSGRENIYMSGTVLGMTRKEISDQFDNIVAFASVEKFIDTPVKRYSSGMVVRLGFAVAAHLKPEILFIDEVLAVGDVQFQNKCLGKMNDIASAGRTVLFVSHNTTMIKSLCSRVIVLDAGQIVMDSTPENGVAEYLRRQLPQKTNNETSMENHPGRLQSKSREPIIKKVWLENDKGEKCNSLPAMGKLRIYLNFEAAEKIRAPNIIFWILNEFGQSLMVMNTAMQPNNADLPEVMDKGTICYEIEKLPFHFGKYILQVAIVDGRSEFIDYIEGALTFSVTQADVYGSGVLPKKNSGVIIAPGKIFLAQ